MSMNLITGTPGSGKTLFAVSQIIKLENENKKNIKLNPSIFLKNQHLISEHGLSHHFSQIVDLNKEVTHFSSDYFDILSLSDRHPEYFERMSNYNQIIIKIKKETGFDKLVELKPVRTIYSDINGLIVDHVLKSPADWRTTPQGSVIYYDEAQQREIFQKTRSTLSESPIVKKFETHRHTGHDIIFITQSPIFLHTHIRELIGEHFHLHRPYGAKLASIYFWRQCQNNPNTKSAKAQSETKILFNYQKSLFDYYKSATIHTHKLRIPTKLVMICAGVLIASVAIYYYAHKSKILNPNAKQDQSAQVTQTHNDSNASKPVDMPQIKILDDQMTKNMIKHQNEMYSHNIEVINYNPLLRVAGVIIHDNDCKAFNEYGERLYLPENDCFTASEYMTHGRSSGNDLRSNAHQGNQQQDTVNVAQPVATQPT